MSKAPSTDRLRRAVELTSFDALQQAEDKTGFAETSAVAKSGRFFRHGAAGRWRDVLSPEQVDQVVRDHGEVMKMVGYDDSVVALLRNAHSSPITDDVPAQNAHLAEELTLRSNVATKDVTLSAAAMHMPPLSNSLPHEARGEREDKKECIRHGDVELDGKPELKKESELTLRSNVATKMQNVIIAYEIYPQTDMPIGPAPISREWMDATQQRYAYRCLPLTVANQAGWVIANPTGYRRWSAERDAYHARVASGDVSAIERGWQKDYFQGHDPGTDRFAKHQTKLGLKPFEKSSPDISSASLRRGLARRPKSR